MKVADKVVLITGASEGIGAACAAVFHERKARLSLSCLSGPDFPRPADALVTVGDITDPGVRDEIVRRTVDRFGTIDILVNNAGVGLYKPPSSAPIELVRRLFEVNVFAPLAMAQLTIPYMKRQGSGTIVNIGSVGGFASLPWASMYCASKFALHAINDSLRRELSRDGIHVMKVAPGIVDTKFREHVLDGTALEKYRISSDSSPPSASPGLYCEEWNGTHELFSCHGSAGRSRRWKCSLPSSWMFTSGANGDLLPDSRNPNEIKGKQPDLFCRSVGSGPPCHPIVDLCLYRSDNRELRVRHIDVFRVGEINQMGSQILV